jgi:chromosome segregation ATPase
LVKLADHCDQLERSKQEYLKQRQEVEQQWKVVNSKYTKVKQRMKQSEQSFKQYEEQAELEILKLKEHADDLRKEIGQKNRELVELAERYVKL